MSLSLLVIPSGFEPETDRLEICCSIQLSYGTMQSKLIGKKKIQEVLNLFVGVAGFEPTTFCSQSRRDTGLRYTPKILYQTHLLSDALFVRVQLSNLRSSRIPNAGRDTRLRYTPKIYLAERGGFEPPVRVTPYDSLANCWFQPLTHLSSFFKPG